MGPSEIGYYTVKDGERSHRYLGWNPLVGCTNNCPTCWARKMAKRLLKCPECKAFTPHVHYERVLQPFYRQKPALILTNFQGDWLDPAFGNPICAKILNTMYDWAKRHTYITLTQHPDRLREVLADVEPVPNVYHGVTITTQEQADERMPDFLQIPGPKWISAEPLKQLAFRSGELKDVAGIIVGHDNTKHWPGTGGLQEVRMLLWRCREEGCPVFVKQIWHEGKFLRASRPAEYALYPEDLKVTQLPWEGASNGLD